MDEEGDSLYLEYSLDMPPNAHSVGGGKKKSKKERAAAAAAALAAANAAAAEQQENNRITQQEVEDSASLSSQENVTVEVAESLTQSVKEEIEKKKVVKVDQDTEEDEEEEVEIEEGNEKDSLKPNNDTEKDLVDFSEDNCEVNQKTSKDESNEIDKLIISMEKKTVLIDTTNEDKPLAPPRKSHQQTAKVAPNNMGSPGNSIMKSVPFNANQKEGVSQRSRNSSISYIKGQVVRPSEPPAATIVGSVAELMHDVIPKSQSQNVHLPAVERADWVQLFSVEKYGNPNEKQEFLVVGLLRGFQIWAIYANGECEEILSERQGPIRACKILGNNFRGKNDVHFGQRPLMAVVDASSHIPDRQYCSVQIYSLTTNSLIHRLTFDEPICALHTTDRYLVVVLSNVSYVYDTLDKFKEIRTIRTASPCENCPPSIAVTGELLAFADTKLNLDLQSGGGLANEIEATSSSAASSTQQYAGQMISAMSSFGRTVKSWSESVGASSTKAKSAHGIMTIIDLSRPSDDSFDVLCHWIAHTDYISYISFSPDQRLVLTSDSTATVYNIFSILPHSVCSSLASVQHLYKLQRGNTPAKICSSAFSLDSRWLSVVTNHGTTHIFAICPFGGKPNQRTHGDTFVNKESRFHRSAGLTDSAEVKAATGQRGQSEQSIYTKQHPVSETNQVLSKCNSNSRIGPFPPPLYLTAVEKIKDNSTDSYSAWASDLAGAVGAATSTTGAANSAAANARKRLDVSRVSIAFSSSKSNKLHLLISRADANIGAIMSEYELRPKKPENGTSSEDAPKLNISPISIWNLQRTKNNADMHLPMPNGSPLVNLAQKSEEISKYQGRRLEDMWTPHVETRTYQAPHRWIWQGPQVTFFEYKEEADTAVLMSPHETSNHRNGQRSIPVMIGAGTGNAFQNSIPSDATRIECGSYTSMNSISASNYDSQNDISMKIADAIRDISSDGPTYSSNNDIDAVEEFFDTHSPSLARRGSSKSSSTKSNIQSNNKKVTCAPLPIFSSSDNSQKEEDDSEDDLDNFEMEEDEDSDI